MESIDEAVDYTNPYEIEETRQVKYTYDDLLTMLCGNEYYSRDEILYVYLKVNGMEEEAKEVLVDIAKSKKHNQRRIMNRLKLSQKELKCDINK